ncbi:MAG: flagellar hook-length control protein FliK [Pontibacterium sp.]
MSDQRVSPGSAGGLLSIPVMPPAAGQAAELSVAGTQPFNALMQSQAAGFTGPIQQPVGDTLPQSGAPLPAEDKLSLPVGLIGLPFEGQVSVKAANPELAEVAGPHVDAGIQTGFPGEQAVPPGTARSISDTGFSDTGSVKAAIQFKEQWPGITPGKTEFVLETSEVESLVQDVLSDQRIFFSPLLNPEQQVIVTQYRNSPAEVLGAGVIDSGQIGQTAPPEAPEQQESALPEEQTDPPPPGLFIADTADNLSALPDRAGLNVVSPADSAAARVFMQPGLSASVMKEAVLRSGADDLVTPPVSSFRPAPTAEPIDGVPAPAADVLRSPGLPDTRAGRVPVPLTARQGDAAPEALSVGAVNTEETSDNLAATGLNSPSPPISDARPRVDTPLQPAEARAPQVQTSLTPRQDGVAPEALSAGADDTDDRLTGSKPGIADKPSAGLRPDSAGLFSSSAVFVNQSEQALKMTASQAQTSLAGKGQMGSPGWNNALSERIVVMTAQRGQVAEIQLDPPELGSLRVRLHIAQDQVNVSFVSPHASVRDAVEQSIPRLREMLEQQGLNLADSSFSEQSGDDSPEQHSSHQAQAGGSDQMVVTGPDAGLAEAGTMSLVDYYA